MNKFIVLIPALLAGIVLGSIFFGGLWWTVRNAISSKHVALLFFGSMLLRTALVVLGFYFILGDDWQKLIAGLLGFVIARIVITRLTRTLNKVDLSEKKDCHAS